MLDYFKAAVDEVRLLTASLRESSVRRGTLQGTTNVLESKFAAPAAHPSAKRRPEAPGADALYRGGAKRTRRAPEGTPSPSRPSGIDPYSMFKQDYEHAGVALAQPLLHAAASSGPGRGAPKPPRAELVPVTAGYAVKTPSPSRRSNRVYRRRTAGAGAGAAGGAEDGGEEPAEAEAAAGLVLQGAQRNGSETLSTAASAEGAALATMHDDGTGAHAEEATHDEMNRACNLCRVPKPLCEFYKVVNNYGKGSTKYATRCKDCIRGDAHRWFDQHRDTMMKVCDKCTEMKCVGEYNMTINYTVFKYAYNHGGAWDRGLERYCRKCTYKHQKEAGIIARKQAKRRERAYGRQQVNVTEKRCSKCCETKAAEMFPKDKYMVDGLYIYCKPCTSAMKKKQKADRLAAQAQMQLKEKECRKCSQVKPVDSFRKSPSNRDGRVNVCKDCQIQQERVRREIQRFNDDEETASEVCMYASAEDAPCQEGMAAVAMQHPQRRYYPHPLAEALPASQLPTALAAAPTAKLAQAAGSER